jgi:hypothetical protein
VHGEREGRGGKVFHPGTGGSPAVLSARALRPRWRRPKPTMRLVTIDEVLEALSALDYRVALSLDPLRDLIGRVRVRLYTAGVRRRGHGGHPDIG